MSMLSSQFSQEQHTMGDTIPAAECNEHIESEVADNVNCESMSVMIGFKLVGVDNSMILIKCNQCRWLGLVV